VFTATSRYADLPTAATVLPDGRRVRYAQRRFLPPTSAVQAVSEQAVTAADRLDLLAGRALGDPEQYWRICDANPVMHPADLLSSPGRRLRIPVSGVLF
jgi:hypothetical protein